MKEKPPDVLVVDLSRLPSHGRQTVLGLRGTKATRGIPVVFVGGTPDKVARNREVFPRELHVSWDGIDAALEKTLADPDAYTSPPPGSSGYSATPLPKKLRIKAGSNLVLVGTPAGFMELLEPLPDGVRVRIRTQGETDVMVFFTTERAALERRLPALVRALTATGGLWIAWPKKGSGVPTDVTEDVVREIALPQGLVDNKVCAIDDTWSALRLVRRLENR